MKTAYDRDKAKWTKFSGKIKKVKLRSYIATLAKSVVTMKLDQRNYEENRQMFIDQYNENGLDGINKLYKGCKIKYLESIIEKTDEQIQTLNKLKSQTNE